MAIIRESAVVAAPPGRVWDAVVDFPSRPAHSPRVKSATVEGGGPLAKGSKVKLHVDNDRFTSTVQDMQPNERLVMLVKGPGFRVNHVYEVKAAPGGAEVTMTGDYRGLLGSLAGRFMRKSVMRDLTDELAAIKVVAEERARGG